MELLTSQLLWRATAWAALLDLPLLLLVARSISAARFARLPRHLAAAAFAWMAALWAVAASWAYWDAVYAAVFPAWSRWWLPLLMGLGFGAAAGFFGLTSRFARRAPAAWFALQFGLLSLVGHSIGIARGLLRVPLLAGVSAASALVFGVFEFVFYGCGIVALAAASEALSRWLGRARRA